MLKVPSGDSYWYARTVEPYTVYEWPSFQAWTILYASHKKHYLVFFLLPVMGLAETIFLSKKISIN